MLRNGLEPWHLLIVAIVMIVLFGSKKLPDTARALGKSLRILKSETRAMKDESPQAETAAQPEAEADAHAAPHIIQVAPGDTTPARPAREGGPTPESGPTASR
ncbi:Sec-independent protein translocase subunit TatA [Streptomyces sp. PRKS01-29]|nr:Sec-independent protein translocase subunit TatA [Streptomyces sabulosicollis]MBI0294169.1 Sec-independent protein translocase subunit TatA [Streptomyces sabulosicollis]